MTDTQVLAALAALEAHRVDIGHRRIRDLFADDPGRATRLQAELDGLVLDYSKHRITDATLAHLIALARAADLEGKRDALFSGVHVNNTEDRAAMHMALRDFSGAPIVIDGEDMRPAIESVRDKMLAFAEAIRSGAVRGATGERITDVVNIGIGGSDLGPAMAARALSPFSGGGPRTHFVSNVDGADIADTLKSLDLKRTLFIISSKTFTTQETMTNAQSARARVAANWAKRLSPITSPLCRRSSISLRNSASAQIACSASGTGWAAAIRSGRPSDWRLPSPLAATTSSRFCAAGTTSTGTSRKRRCRTICRS